MAWVMPALYPANPWTFGLPPSESGQLAKCGMGLSLRLRGEKPIEPCRGRCSFGTGHSSVKVVSRRVQRDGGGCHAAVTLPAGAEGPGPHFRDPQADCPGASGRRVGRSLWGSVI